MKCTHVGNTDGRSASRSCRPSPSPATIVGRCRPRQSSPSTDTTPASTPATDAPPTSSRTLRSRPLRPQPSTSSDITPMPPPPKRQKQAKARESIAAAKATGAEKPSRSKYELTPRRCICAEYPGSVVLPTVSIKSSRLKPRVVRGCHILNST